MLVWYSKLCFGTIEDSGGVSWYIMESVDAGCSNNRLTYWKEQGKCTRQKKMGHKHKTIQHFDTKCFHQEQLK